MSKLTFWEWCDKQERLEGEASWEDWYKEYISKVINRDDLIHAGDCTSQPIACMLCCVERLLKEYKEYYFEST